MSSYTLQFDEIGLVKVTKKRGMRSIRLRISPKGDVLVSAPWSVPRIFIEKFINERKKWILENATDSQAPLKSGMVIGSNTVLNITDGNGRNRTSHSTNTLNIKLAGIYNPSNKAQQQYIEKKIIEAMQTEAEYVLLPRLDYLAKTTGHEFNQAYIKRLTSRWGSCDSNQNIILNVFLLQLPKELQDYVMLHELTHTKYMNHSPAFWKHMETLVPKTKQYRKLLKTHRPRIEAKIQPYPF